MRKAIIAVVSMLFAANTVQAVKPIETEGYDRFGNSFKLDVVSLLYVAPQVMWEHFTDTRFSYGIYAQAHFMNRSTFRDMEKSPGKTTFENGEKYDTKWDRRYAGVMVCPEGRYYVGSKPARGFYLAARADMGLFRESFDVKRRHVVEGVENKEEDYIFLYNEKGDLDFGLGCGFGIGCQYYFGQNSRWGMDVNCFLKSDWKLGDDDENVWEWFWGPGLLADLNISILYRF